MSFADFFQAATGNVPFPWQCRLYEHFAAGRYPTAANIPTGLGKTSVVAIWLIALALHPETTPRRLVYVVNRRTVVDQTTDEVEKIRQSLSDNTGKLKEISDKLRNLCALPLPSPDAAPLAISTLRGQHADNREWSADPTRPAVIIGTVDMIGSGLLFSRYTVGFKLRPHHAAFLAQDVLLVHDEAHLEPAFQQLLDTIVAEQKHCNDPRKLRVIELTATSRSNIASEPFRISEEDSKNNFVKQRFHAVKALLLCALKKDEKEHDSITKFAIAQQESKRAILIFVRLAEDAMKIATELEKKSGIDKVRTLTGTMRGKERDELVKDPVFQCFLQKDVQKLPVEGTVFLVATSAGEVGVNISADDLICDLSTYESMAQRFGRVNRFGERDDSTITVVHPLLFGKQDKQGKLAQSEMDIARERTLALLQQLPENASPAALDQLPVAERTAAFSPPPQTRIATAIQFDAWALTSIRKPIAARPPVAPYLHGEDEWQPPETHLAWREELDVIHGDLLAAYPPEDLLEDFPLKPHELLRDTSKRIAETLSKRIEKFFLEKHNDEEFQELRPAWLVHEDGSVQSIALIENSHLLSIYKKNDNERNKEEKGDIKRHKDQLKEVLENATLILPASLGGISEQGLFVADARKRNRTDVADISNIRLKNLSILYASSPDIPAEYKSDYRLVRVIDTKLADESDAESTTRYWLWLEAKKTINGEKRSTVQKETLAAHSTAVLANISALTKKLFPATPADGKPNLAACMIAAGQGHDLGKNRRPWQQSIGNIAYDSNKPETILAKSGPAMHGRNVAENYRHEFGSLNTLATCNANGQATDLLAPFSEHERDIIFHLIAAHHGRARPHFPVEEILDYGAAPEDNVTLAAKIPRRFARLQQCFGRWGLAWLESILRAADYAASAGIVADQTADTVYPQPTAPPWKANIQKTDTNQVRLRVDVTNPGQYFACCGLFELTARLSPDTLGWFEQDEDKQWWFVLSETIYSLSTLLEKIVEAEIIAIEPENTAKTAIIINAPFNITLDWWRYEGGSIGKLKTWAGNMSVCPVANDMKQAFKKELSRNTTCIENILFVSSSATESQPYYFDANYAVNAQAQDVGFSMNNLKDGGVKIKTSIMPAVEFLCLVGVQRARPLLGVNEKGKERLYDYRVWNAPLPISLISAAIAGVVPAQYQHLRFANPSRARDYRAFMPAILL